MSIHIDPIGRRTVVPANLTRAEVKRLRKAAGKPKPRRVPPAAQDQAAPVDGTAEQ